LEINKRNKAICVIKDGVILGKYESIIKVIYEYHISYASIRKSIKNGSYIKGYKFKDILKQVVA